VRLWIWVASEGDSRRIWTVIVFCRNVFCFFSLGECKVCI
jgi:hypothetical protein